MLAYNIETLNKPDPDFAIKQGSPNYSTSNLLILGAVAVVVIPIILVSSPLALSGIIIAIGVFLGLVISYIAIDLREVEFMKPYYEAKVKRIEAYNRWYVEDLLPFLSRKYELEFIDPSEPKRTTDHLFSEKGQLAKTRDGEFVWVAVGGIIWYAGINRYMYDGQDVHFIFNNEIWLNKITGPEILNPNALENNDS